MFCVGLPCACLTLHVLPICRRARASSPAIIFFDEIDGLAKMREASGEGGVGVGERMLAQLLQEMDGLQVRQLRNVPSQLVLVELNS